MSNERLRIGFIPLCDATALIVAVDKGFAAAEGLDIELVREVSWSNIRDKLNIGLFDAAHLIAPVAIASSLGIGHVKVPIRALNLASTACITVSPALYGAIAAGAVELASEASGQRGHFPRARRTLTPEPGSSARAELAQRRAPAYATRRARQHPDPPVSARRPASLPAARPRAKSRSPSA
jgi:hypothetical protein